MKKAFWKSKTLWVNVVTLGLAVAKPVLGVDTIPQADPMYLAMVNIVLRLITNRGVSVTDEP